MAEKPDKSSQNLDAELKRQRRLITLLLNRERIQKRQQSKGTPASTTTDSKYQKEIEKSSKKLNKLMEDEIKLNHKLSKIAKDLHTLSKREAELLELSNRLQNEANTLSDEELRLLQQEYDLKFEELEVAKDNLLLNQRSFQEDLQYNREEQKRHEKNIKNAEKLQKEVEEMAEDVHDVEESLDDFSSKFDGLTDIITAWNIADIKNSLEDDAQSSRDLYREIANKMGKNMDEVIGTVKPIFKEQQKMYHDVFTSSEYLEALNAIVDTGKHSLDEAGIMAGTMAAMEKDLFISADSMEQIYTWFNSSQLNHLGDNLAGIKNTLSQLEIDNVSIDELSQSIDELAPKLANKDQDFQDAILANIAALQAYSVDTGAFTENLNELMSSTLSRGALLEEYGGYSVDLADAVKSGDTEKFQREMDKMISIVQGSQNIQQIEAWYGGLVDDTMYEQIKSGNFTAEDYNNMLNTLKSGMAEGSLQDNTKLIYDNMKTWDKFYNKFISGSWVEDLAQSDFWEDFGFIFQYGGLKLGETLLSKWGPKILQGLGNFIKHPITSLYTWGDDLVKWIAKLNPAKWFNFGNLGTTITNSLQTAWNWVVNLVKTPIDDIVASLGSSGIMGTLSTIAGYISQVLVLLGIFDQGKATWDVAKEIREGKKTGDYSGIKDAMEESWIYKGATWLEKKLRKSNTSKLEAMVEAADTGGTLKEVKYIDENGDVATRYEAHAGGLSYVPYDGYNATLHKGERVLTSEEAKRYGLSEDLFYIVKDIRETILGLRRDQDTNRVKAQSQYAAFNNIGGVASTFTNGTAPASGGGILGAISNAVDSVKDKTVDFVQKLKEAASGTWDNIKTKAKELWENTKEFAGQAWDTVKDKVKAGWNNLIDGSHKNGLDYVPKDGYVAKLHKGERVLTADESRDYSSYYNAIDQNAASSRNLLKKITSHGVIQQANAKRSAYLDVMSQTPAMATTTGTTGVTTTGTGDPLVSSGDYARDVWNYMTKSLGYSKQATAGVMGNMEAESGVNPTTIQSKGKGPAAGICQWENINKKSKRWKEMSDFAASRGKEWTDLESQLIFLDKELAGTSNDTYTNTLLNKRVGGYNAFKSLSNIETAAYEFMKCFERPGVEHLDRRYKSANAFYNQFSAYEQGTPWVPDTQLALLHKGEMVVPADVNPFNTSLSSNSTPSSSNSDTDDVVESINELKTTIKNAIDYIGRKMDRKQSIEIKQDTKISNTLNDRYKERQYGKRGY